MLSEVLTPGHEGVTFHEPGQLASVRLALATADLSTTPAFAAARAWLAGNPGERWEAQWPRAASAFMQRV